MKVGEAAAVNYQVLSESGHVAAVNISVKYDDQIVDFLVSKGGYLGIWFILYFLLAFHVVAYQYIVRLAVYYTLVRKKSLYRVSPAPPVYGVTIVRVNTSGEHRLNFSLTWWGEGGNDEDTTTQEITRSATLWGYYPVTPQQVSFTLTPQLVLIPPGK